MTQVTQMTWGNQPSQATHRLIRIGALPFLPIFSADEDDATRLISVTLDAPLGE